MAVVAQEQRMWIVGHGEAGERPEAGGRRVRVDLRGALEADDGLWVALLEEHVGPVASVDSLVVDQALGARVLARLSIFALDVAGGALVVVLVDAKLVFAAGCRQWSRWKSEVN